MQNRITTARTIYFLLLGENLGIVFPRFQNGSKYNLSVTESVSSYHKNEGRVNEVPGDVAPFEGPL